MEWLTNLIGSQTGNLLAGLGGFAAQNEAIKDIQGRSEERRVGKECRTRWSPDH